MKCPKCDGKLTAVTMAGFAVEQCDKCSGIWFELGELEMLRKKGIFTTVAAFFKGLL